MNLVQLNAWGGRLEYRVLDFFEKNKADIICLQEAIEFKGDAGLFATIEQIQEKTKNSYSVVSPVFSFTYMNDTAEFGNCILSKYPVKKSETIFTNLEYTKHFDFNTYGNAGMRNFIHAIIETPDGDLNVITHHGHHIGEHKNGNDETMRQMKQLGEYIDNLEGPLIVAGDFNLAPHSASLEQINSRLENLSIRHKLETTRTPLTHKKEVCDYIFINDSVEVKKFFASDEVVSDHQALMLSFAVK